MSTLRPTTRLQRLRRRRSRISPLHTHRLHLVNPRVRPPPLRLRLGRRIRRAHRGTHPHRLRRRSRHDRVRSREDRLDSLRRCSEGSRGVHGVRGGDGDSSYVRAARHGHDHWWCGAWGLLGLTPVDLLGLTVGADLWACWCGYDRGYDAALGVWELRTGRYGALGLDDCGRNGFAAGPGREGAADSACGVGAGWFGRDCDDGGVGWGGEDAGVGDGVCCCDGGGS